MGMQFSPMYQPVSTKTIKADGDLNVNPYDLLATDGKFDTVEADEFVGGVGNFTKVITSSSLLPKYNLSTNPINALVTINGTTYSTTENQRAGTYTWFNGVLYSSTLNTVPYILSEIQPIDSIPISIYTHRESSSRYVALAVDGVEVLRTTSGTKTYNLPPDDFKKTITITMYLDSSDYVAGISSATIPNVYLVK